MKKYSLLLLIVFLVNLTLLNAQVAPKQLKKVINKVVNSEDENLKKNPEKFISVPNNVASNCGTAINASRLGLFLRDGDFELFGTSVAGSCDININNPYVTANRATLQDNCVDTKWKVSHGTPEICKSESNHFVHLWAGDWSGDGDYEGEGVFFNCTFSPDTCYTINLRFRSNANINKINVKLARGLVHKVRDANTFVPESAFYKTPLITSSFYLQEIATINNFNNPNWQIYSFTFVPNTYFMSLWIYPEDDKILSQSNYNPDILHIDEVDDGLDGTNRTCANSLSFTSSPIPPFSEAITISASNQAKVSNVQNITFSAGNWINLGTGFEVAKGGSYLASINPCVNGNTTCVINTFPQGKASDSKNLNLQTELILIPNPVRSTFNIYLDDNNEVIENIKVLDKFQTIVFESNYSNTKNIEINAESFRDDIYLVQITTNRGNYYKRIIISK
jgi:hypothetical protein